MKAVIFQVPYPRKGGKARSIQWICDELKTRRPGEADFILRPEYSDCLGAANRDEVLQAIRGAGKKLLGTLRNFADQSGIAVMAGVVNEDAQGHLYGSLFCPVRLL